MVCPHHVPRQPRPSPVWQILSDHWEKVPNLSPEASSAIRAFLECGDLHVGFARLRGHEYLLAFSCKQRGLCASWSSRLEAAIAKATRLEAGSNTKPAPVLPKNWNP